MILGILSDTHGNVARTETALRVLERAGAQGFVHCGDIGGLEVLEVLRREPRHGLPGWVVCGNTDFADPVLVKYGELQNLTVAPAGPLWIDAIGRRVVVFHGHEPEFGRLLAYVERHGEVPSGYGGCEYVLHGHTHVVADRIIGPLRVINPGALQRAIVHTAATLDLTTQTVRFWRVNDYVGGDPIEYNPRST